MEVNFNSELCKTVFEKNCTFLTGIACNAYASYIETTLCKSIDQAKHILVIGDSKVTTHFIFVNIGSTDDDDDFSLVTELHEHTELAVWFESWKNTGSVVIIKEFSAEFKVKLVVKFADTVTDMFGLHCQILFIIKSNFHLSISFPSHLAAVCSNLVKCIRV